MAKIYVSSHHQDPANELADKLTAAGHTVTSTWHLETGERPAMDDGQAWNTKVNDNFDQIEESDVLVLIASPEHLDGSKRVAGGKFVEAGYALGNGAEVYTLGGVENGMLHAAGGHALTADDLLGMIG